MATARGWAAERSSTGDTGATPTAKGEKCPPRRDDRLGDESGRCGNKRHYTPRVGRRRTRRRRGGPLPETVDGRGEGGVERAAGAGGEGGVGGGEGVWRVDTGSDLGGVELGEGWGWGGGRAVASEKMSE